MTDALGQSQILPYLTRLSQQDVQIIILSFEKKEKFEKGKIDIEEIISNKNIIWVPLTYTKKPPVVSTLLDIKKGKGQAAKIYQQYKYSIVHCRGYVAALIGLYLKNKFGVKFIFDMRGWWADEKLESGFWSKKIYQPVYQYVKKLEKIFFNKADFIVSLTEAGKREIVRQQLAPEEKIGVIPTCVDFTIFKPFNIETRAAVRTQLNIPQDAKVLIYSGSLGGNYDMGMIMEIFESFSNRFPGSYLLILSKDVLPDNELAALKSKGNIIITNAPFKKVTDYLMAGDAGLIIYKPAFSVIGRSPTKLGEYWASGLPAISLKGIGDLDSLCERYDSGDILLNADLSDIETKIYELSFLDKDQLRINAKNYYDVERGVAFYYNIYNALE